MKKNNTQFPNSIYLIVFIYSILAFAFIYDSIISFELIHSRLEYLMITIMLIYLRIKPINYTSNTNTKIELTFFYPVIIIYGLQPVIIAMAFQLFFVKGNSKTQFFKRYFNFINRVVAAYLTYYLFQYFNSIDFIAGNLGYIVVIIISSVCYSLLIVAGTSAVAYLEKKIKPNKFSLRIFESNIMNGIITYFLYLALGTFGVFVAVLYAILFSRRSLYKLKYYRTNSELKETEQRLRLIFETIDYGIIMFDMERQIKMANPVAMNFLEALCQRPIGKKLHELTNIYPEQIYQLVDWTYINRQNHHRKKVTFEIKNKVLCFDIYTYPYNVTEGKMDGIILFYKNVTEEQMIKKQLIEADKLSQLGQLAAGKVHEIRNPLTTVRGYLQFLQQKVAKGETINLNHFDIAVQELDRTNEIINSLLILSKQSNQEVEEIELDTLIEDVIQLFYHQILAKNITLLKKIDEGLYILGIENHLKQIFINLLVNAIDALSLSNKESKSIIIKSYQIKDKIKVEIEDNGVGISEENLEKLQLPFYTTKVTGTGLGLSVTYKLIEEYKGTIEVLSEVNRGTKFIIAFPAVE